MNVHFGDVCYVQVTVVGVGKIKLSKTVLSLRHDQWKGKQTIIKWILMRYAQTGGLIPASKRVYS